MYGLRIAQSRPMRLGAFELLPSVFDPALAANLTALAAASSDDILRTLSSQIQQLGRDIRPRILSAIDDSIKTISDRGLTDSLVDFLKSPFTSNNDYTEMLKKLGAIRLIGFEWINETKASWFDNKLNLEYEKIDQEDAKRVEELFAKIVSALDSVTDIIKTISEIPEALALQGVNDFYRYFWSFVEKAIAEIKNTAKLAISFINAGLKAATKILEKVPEALEWLPIVLVAVGAIGVIYLLS